MDACCKAAGETSMPRCVLEVSTADIQHNYQVLCKLCSTRLIAVVKNNGYGLGLIPYGKLLVDYGVDCLAVSSVEEGILLRKSGIQTDILVMTPPENADCAGKTVSYDLIAAVGCIADLCRMESAAASAGTVGRVHVKVDTGFGRYGFSTDAVFEAAENLLQDSHLRPEGVFTHCGMIRPRQVREQYARFMKSADILCSKLNAPLCRHFCHSALALKYPELQLNAVRVGSALLGRIAETPALDLKPIGRLKARVQDIHMMPAGSRPGYGGAERISRSTRVAVVAVGWQDGFGLDRRRDAACPRELLSQMYRLFAGAVHRRYVYHEGRPVPILGHGGMNFTLLNVSDSDLAVGDWVTMQVNPLLVPAQIRREYY